MTRVVIDSSVWVAGLLSNRGASHEVLLRGLKGGFEGIEILRPGDFLKILREEHL